MNVEALVDDRLRHWREIADKHFPKDAPLELVVLKGHLIIEEMLTSFIAHYARAPALLGGARLQFFQKMTLVKALIAPPIQDEVWAAIEILNKIRNDYSHGLEPVKLKDHLNAAKAIVAALRKGKKGIAEPDLSSDEMVIISLVSFCQGYLMPIDALISIMEKNRKYG